MGFLSSSRYFSASLIRGILKHDAATIAIIIAIEVYDSRASSLGFSPFAPQLYRECVDRCISWRNSTWSIRKTIVKCLWNCRRTRGIRACGVNDVFSTFSSLGTFFIGDDNGVTGNVTINFTRIPILAAKLRERCSRRYLQERILRNAYRKNRTPSL